MPVKPVFEEVIEISRTVEESGAGQRVKSLHVVGSC